MFAFVIVLFILLSCPTPLTQSEDEDGKRFVYVVVLLSLLSAVMYNVIPVSIRFRLSDRVIVLLN